MGVCDFFLIFVCINYGNCLNEWKIAIYYIDYYTLTFLLWFLRACLSILHHHWSCTLQWMTFFFFLVSLVSVEAFVLLAVLCLYICVDVYFIIDEFSYLSVLFTCTMHVACSPWQGYLPLLSVSQFIMFSGSRLSVLCSYSLWDASGFTF